MQRSQVAFVMLLVVACVSSMYLMNRHLVPQDAGVGGTTPGRNTADKTGGRDTRSASDSKWKPKSLDEKFKASLPSDLNPEQAKKLLAEFLAKNLDVFERDHYAVMLMEKLCHNGYSEEAWGLIPEEKGQLRQSLISSYFTYADLPSDQLLSKLAQAGRDTGRGFMGYLARFGPTELAEVVSSEGVQDLLKNMDPVDRQLVHVSQKVRNVLTLKLSESPISNLVIVNTAAEMNAKGQLDSLDFLDLLRADKTTNAFEKWDRMCAIDVSTVQRKDALMRERDRLISAMIKENAPETLDQMLKSEDSYRDRDLAAALNSWIDNHSSEAGTWFEKSRGKMDLHQQTVAASAFVNKALQAGEFEGAWLWAKEIPDEARRAETLAALEAKQAAKQKTAAEK